jgi:hypothetical protein
MTHERNIVAVQWPGLHSLKAARDAIQNGAEVEIELPEGTHYTLYRHLNPGATGTAVEELDATGGAEILDSIATVHGLEELARLRAAVARAHYRVRVTSPDPVLRLTPPQTARRRSR